MGGGGSRGRTGDRSWRRKRASSAEGEQRAVQSERRKPGKGGQMSAGDAASLSPRAGLAPSPWTFGGVRTKS